MCDFYTRPCGIGLAEFLGILSCSHFFAEFMISAGLESDETEFLLGYCVLRSRRTGRTVLPEKARFKVHPWCWKSIWQPGNTFLAYWTGADLCLSVASQSILNVLLSKPALSRNCQLGFCATGSIISTPYSRLLTTSTLASVYPLSTM